MHIPGDGSPWGGGQWDWLGRLVGEEIWEQVQETLRTARPPSAPIGRSEVRHGAAPDAFPPVDLYLTTWEAVLSAALPGLVSPSHLVVGLADPVTVVVEAFLEPPPSQAALLHRERQAGYVSRTVSLPAPVTAGGARVSYDRGILELRLPLAQPGHGENAVSVLAVT